MKRRVRKKLYKRHLFNVAIDVSQLHDWRRRLLESDCDVRYRLDHDSPKNVQVFEKDALKQHRLIYIVSKVSTVNDRKYTYDAKWDGLCTVAFRLRGA